MESLLWISLLCLHVQRDESLQKLKDVTNAIEKELGDLCTCDITSNNIIEETFLCFDGSSHFVTYQAQLRGTPEADSHTLIGYLEKWVSGEPSVLIQGVLIRIDNDCPVSITSIDDIECNKMSTSSSQSYKTVGIIGGIVVASVLIIGVLVFTLVMVWKCCHGKHSLEKTNEWANNYLLSCCEIVFILTLCSSTLNCYEILLQALYTYTDL